MPVGPLHHGTPASTGLDVPLATSLDSLQDNPIGSLSGIFGAPHRKEWETAWVETGRVFTKENGEMLHPANVTRRFIELYEEIGLPPVRLHDLRHGAATYAHAAGADLKDIQEMLGHSSITITSDTYTSLLPEADLAIAEAAARLVPRARAASENTASAAKPEPDEAEKPDPESVPDDADPLGDIREINSPSAHAPLTQTAPDEESEAE